MDPRSRACVMSVVVLLVSLTVPPHVLGQAQGQSSARDAVRGVEGFLNADGQLDEQLIRSSGYEGPLPMTGYQVQRTDNNGPLHFEPNQVTGTMGAMDLGGWSALASGIDDGEVRALAVYNSQLIAAGTFTTINGATVNRIAAWDGSSWSPLGLGMNFDVYALTVFDSKLIAAGLFTTVDGVADSSIAAWDGSSWTPLGTGINNNVQALAVYNSTLIAAGFFSRAGGVVVNNIAAWNGSSWSALGDGVGFAAFALADFGSDLIVGGVISTAGGMPVNNIAAWDGSAWSTLGAGVNSTVRALAVYDSKLIAGGLFTEAGGNPADNVASWDGSNWTSLGSGTNAPVYSLSNFNSKLIVAGDFTAAGGSSANYVATWDGSSWSTLGLGLGNGARSLGAYALKLIVGGMFTTAGGGAANRIAAWTPIDSDGDGIANDIDNCPDTSNPGQEDTDGDGVGNVCDNCPNLMNAGQEDDDGDGVGNACDNCPSVFNLLQTDSDSDGYGAACDCDDAASGVHPGATEICDGLNVDEDCNGLADGDDPGAVGGTLWYPDSDADGFGSASGSVTACDPPVGYVADNTDCDDSQMGVHPGAAEVCNGADDNCDGFIDEGDVCCSCPFQTDLNGDGFVDAVDLAIEIDIVFFGQPDTQDPVCPTTRGDFNGDGVPDAVDLAFVIDYVFFGGAGPANPCSPDNPVSWITGVVSLTADHFFFVADGDTFYSEPSSLTINSDPGNPTYCTLELEWMENGVEQRFYIYFQADGSDWWSDEFRTRDGKMPADWIYYTGEFFRTPLGTEFTGDVEIDADLGNDYPGSIYFRNLHLQAFLTSGAK